MKISDIRPEVYDMAAKAQERLAGRFAEIDRVAEAIADADAEGSAA